MIFFSYLSFLFKLKKSRILHPTTTLLLIRKLSLSLYISIYLYFHQFSCFSTLHIHNLNNEQPPTEHTPLSMERRKEKSNKREGGWVSGLRFNGETPLRRGLAHGGGWFTFLSSSPPPPPHPSFTCLKRLGKLIMTTPRRALLLLREGGEKKLNYMEMEVEGVENKAVREGWMNQGRGLFNLGVTDELLLLWYSVVNVFNIRRKWRI